MGTVMNMINYFKDSEVEYFLYRINTKIINFINPHRFVPEYMINYLPFQRPDRLLWIKQEVRLFYYHNIYSLHFMFYCDLMDVLKMFHTKKYD
jgi:hypothetical protein